MFYIQQKFIAIITCTDEQLKINSEIHFMHQSSTRKAEFEKHEEENFV